MLSYSVLRCCLPVPHCPSRWDKAPGNARAFQSTSRAVGEAPGGGGGEPETMDVDGPEGPASHLSAGGFSFRGDSRWLGVSKARGSDRLAGFGASGSLVYADLS